jgi:hypothetical protein
MGAVRGRRRHVGYHRSRSASNHPRDDGGRRAGAVSDNTVDGLAALETGSEVRLLLTRIGDKHHIAGTFLGAFQIRNGRLIPLSGKQNFASEYRDMNANEADRRLVEQARGLR